MTRPGMDLTCEELVELVSDYLEGAMSPEERLRFEDHVEICEGCRNYLEQMRKTILVTGHLREEHVPGEAQERLLEAFRGWKSGS